MGHCPNIPQPSELQHQVPLGGTKQFESLLQFDIDLSRFQLLCLLHGLFQKELNNQMVCFVIFFQFLNITCSGHVEIFLLYQILYFILLPTYL